MSKSNDNFFLKNHILHTCARTLPVKCAVLNIGNCIVANFSLRLLKGEPFITFCYNSCNFLSFILNANTLKYMDIFGKYAFFLVKF